jgi:predicted GNAT family acetyltransferase
MTGPRSEKGFVASNKPGSQHNYLSYHRNSSRNTIQCTYILSTRHGGGVATDRM